MVEKTCAVCDGAFEDTTHNQSRKYCSDSCNPHKSTVERQKECAVCGEEFIDESQTNMRKYCSDSCNPNIGRPRKKECPYCESSFEDDTKKNSMTYCSSTCRRKQKRIRQAKRNNEESPTFLDEITRNCEYCESPFTPNRSNQKYCSDECRETDYREEQYSEVPDCMSLEIDCEICGETFSGRIPKTHFAFHDISQSTYCEKFGDGRIYSEAAKWKMSQAEREFPDDFGDRVTKWLTEYYEENEVWNKGETKETNDSVRAVAEKASKRLSDPENNPFYGKTHDKETRRIISKKVSEVWRDPEFRSKMETYKRLQATEGEYVSEPHAALIQANIQANIWEEGFEKEAFVTLIDGTKHPVDIACREAKIAIEVDGCVFHNCPDHCSYEELSPAWQKNIDRNEQVDEKVNESLNTYGWNVIRFWEHEVKNDLSSCVEEIAACLDADVSFQGSYKDIVSSFDEWVEDLLSNNPNPYNQQTLEEWDDEAVFWYFRKNGFPEYRFEASDISEDWKTFCELEPDLTKDGDISIPSGWRPGEKATKHFMDHIWDASKRGKRSARERFHDDDFLWRLIQNRRKHANTLTHATMRTGIKLLTHTPTMFPAVLAKWIADRYGNEGPVLDPCAGFGGRMLGTVASGMSYVGVDPWDKTCRRLRQICKFLSLDDVRIECAPFEDYGVQDSFELVMTSPPHFDKEEYGGTNQSIDHYPCYSDWRECFLTPLFEKSYDALIPDGTAVFHLTDGRYPLVTDSLSMLDDVGFDVDRKHWKRWSPLQATERSEPLLICHK